MKSWVRKAKRGEQQVALTSLEALAQSAQYIKKRSNQSVQVTLPGVDGTIEIPRKSFFLLNNAPWIIACGYIDMKSNNIKLYLVLSICCSMKLFSYRITYKSTTNLFFIFIQHLTLIIIDTNPSYSY
jgi:hypothetical protein